MFAVNYLAVFIAALVSMILGMVWYSSALFGRQWTALMGIDPNDKEKMEKMKKESGLPKFEWAITAIGTFIMAYILALFFIWLGVEDPINGMIFAIFIWVGFIATATFTNVLFEKKSKKLWAINSGYHFVALLFMSSILTFLK